MSYLEKYEITNTNVFQILQLCLFLGVNVLTGLCPLPLAPVPLRVCFQSNDSFLHACFPFSPALYFFSQHNTSYIIWEFHTMHPGHTFFPSLPSHKKKRRKKKFVLHVVIGVVSMPADSQLRKREGKGFCDNLPNKKKLSRQESSEESS